VETLNSLQQNVFLLGTLEKETKGKINAVKQARVLNMKGLKDFELLLERQRQKAPGPYSMGTFSPTIVDAVLVPQLYNARRFGLDTEKEFPILAMIDSKCSTHPWFVSAEPSKQPDAQKDF
jgi:glutathione S-transferase